MPPTIEQLQARHQTLAREAVRARQALADLRRQVRRHERMIAALGGVEPPDDMTLSIAECRALVDYLDACLIAEAHQPSAIVAIRDRALAALRRVDRPNEPEDAHYIFTLGS